MSQSIDNSVTDCIAAADNGVVPRRMHFIDHEGQHYASYIISFTLIPGVEAQFLQLLRPVLDAMRHEPTFINAILHRDPSAANRYMLYESWSDAEDLVNVQVHRTYRAAFWAGLPALLKADREVQTWEPIRGDFAFEASEVLVEPTEPTEAD